MKWTSFPAGAWHGLSESANGLFLGRTPEALQLADRLNGDPDAGVPDEIPPAFLDLASRVEDVFQIEAPDAPGIYFVGAMTAPGRHLAAPDAAGIVSAGACGATFRRAVIACMGEMAERLAQFGGDGRFVRPAAGNFGEGLAPGRRRELLDLLGKPPDPRERLPGLMARHLPDGSRMLVPASLCLRFPGAEPAVNPGIGCACGRTAEDAILAGLLEWIERDAAALWWHAGHPGRMVSLETLEEAGLLAMIPAMRRGRDARRTWMIDITSDLDVPCVACVSVNADGRGFAHGAAARLSLAAAAKAAFIELCQMEVAWHLMELKRAAGRQPTSPADLRHQARFDAVDVDVLAMLAPGRTPARGASPAWDLESLVQRLAEAGYPSLAVDLSRPEIGLPVFKVIVPGLQPLPSSVTTARLARAVASASASGGTTIPLY